MFLGADECSAVCRSVCTVAKHCAQSDTLCFTVAKLLCFNRTLMWANVLQHHTREDNLWTRRYVHSKVVLSC
jgi:hypothetical protein